MTYAYLILGLSILVLLNRKFFAKVLSGIVLFSIVFFYAEFNQPYLMEKRKINDVLILLGITAGLFLISGKWESECHGKDISIIEEPKVEKI